MRERLAGLTRLLERAATQQRLIEQQVAAAARKVDQLGQRLQEVRAQRTALETSPARAETVATAANRQRFAESLEREQARLAEDLAAAEEALRERKQALVGASQETTALKRLVERLEAESGRRERRAEQALLDEHSQFTTAKGDH